MHNDESAPAAKAPRATDLAEIRQKLTASVARVCPRWSADQREEILQGALVRLAERLEQDEEIEGFGASYLWRVAFTATVDEVRRRQRRREVPLDETSVTTLADGTAVDPEQRMAGRQLGAGILACLSGLIRSRRLALALHLQGHSVLEAARLLGWPAKKTENLVYRGLSDLRSCLEGKGLKP
jgi:RNA polymerase sigma-70 factor (ECF subfamily)